MVRGQRFYREATVATGLSAVDEGAARRMDEALHAIDQVDSGDFYLSLSTDGLPRMQVAVGDLRRSVQRWIGGLDHDDVKAQRDRGEIEELVIGEPCVTFTNEAVPPCGDQGSCATAPSPRGWVASR
jgi:hypothetical protein